MSKPVPSGGVKMVDETRYLCRVIMKTAAIASGIQISGYSFEAGFIQTPNKASMVSALESQKRFETNPEIIRSLELCKNSVILFGIPTIPAGRDSAELTWGDDRRNDGIKPSGITVLREIRYLDNSSLRSN